MGTAWCRERVEQAQNSKSPIDRILITCSNVFSNKQTSGTDAKIADDFVFQGMRKKGVAGRPPPIPVHLPPPRTRLNGSNVQQTSAPCTEWRLCTLTVPETETRPDTVAPVPPPRKKRKKRISSLELLNSQLELLGENEEIIDWQKENDTNLRTERNNNVQLKTEPFLCLEASKENQTKTKNRFLKSPGTKLTKKDRLTPFTKTDDDKKYERGQNDNKQKTRSGEKTKIFKNISTVSLPNYNELIKPERKTSSELENGDDKRGNQSVGGRPPHRNKSTVSLPGEGSSSLLSSLSEATIQRLDNYMKRCRSFGSLKPHQLLEKLEEMKNQPSARSSESSDSWCGLDDWDVGMIEHYDGKNSSPPVSPRFVLTERRDERPKFSFDTSPEDDDSPPILMTTHSEEVKNIIETELNLSLEDSPKEWYIGTDTRWSIPNEKNELTNPFISKYTDIEASSEVEHADDKDPHSILLSLLKKYNKEENESVEAPKGDSFDADGSSHHFSGMVADDSPPVPPKRRYSHDAVKAKISRKKRAMSLSQERIPLVENGHLKSSDVFKVDHEHINEVTDMETVNLRSNESPKEVNRKKSLTKSLSEFLGFEKVGSDVLQNEKDDTKSDISKASETQLEDMTNNYPITEARWKSFLYGDKNIKSDSEDESTPPPLPLNPPPIKDTSSEVTKFLDSSSQDKSENLNL